MRIIFEEQQKNVSNFSSTPIKGEFVVVIEKNKTTNDRINVLLFAKNENDHL